ncbi:hypothetical protein ACIGBH_33720 [Streptomyces sp. NPDC085929]|uniref:hypothetical protein n=1 Tax=Streptomyces sp. NPDC085929 TaxID=3365739 RepID=UPI0037CED89F
MSAFGFSRWAFLSEPLSAVLTACSATVEPTSTGAGFMGGVRAEGDRLTVLISDDVTELERDLTVRGLLAAWHFVDVTDWPVTMWVKGGQS